MSAQTRRSWPAILALLLVFHALVFHASAAETPATGLPVGGIACDIPPSPPASAASLGLPHLAAALRHGGPVDILAVGSATVLGARLEPEGSFPVRALEILRASLPGANLRLTLIGERGETAAQMLVTLKQKLSAQHYALVLWQTGSVEAAHHAPAAPFAAVLRQGAGQVAAAGSDLILIDPQFTRTLEARADTGPYRAAILAETGAPGRQLFARYALMQHWDEAGQLNLDQPARRDRKRTVTILHDCLARALAQQVLAQAKSGP